ncbi:fumarylacetoacetate hydrolase family protein [Actinomadura nitritigenes]|uniref:fumarylacetoacetate hydrolase family protein n=1 Tax=Actinomadura nitritigenes TaxID=134602 RepID=UPI003D904586
MKLVGYEHAGAAGVGMLTDEGVLPTGHTDMIGLIRSGAEVRATGGPLRGHRLTAPLPRPGKIFGSGINYASHFTENPKAVMPEEPGFFVKFASSVIGPDDTIVLPSPDADVDYEVELAVVIGRSGMDIAPADALGHVFGYTLVNDISARAIQFRHMQTPLGKGCDTFCPMGPAIVTPDEIPDISALRLTSHVNGEIRQDATCAEMLFDIPTLVAHASRAITLEPGDVITTGTPAGCGTFREPPLWLAPGDEVEIAADAIGRLRNPVAAGW